MYILFVNAEFVGNVFKRIRAYLFEHRWFQVFLVIVRTQLKYFEYFYLLFAHS